MRMYDIIDKKRNGYELTSCEIEFFIKGYVKGEIPDYQISALLMAICCKGMTDAETACLTAEMASSGETLDLSSLENSVDKHSTGGVGDKTTLIVAPIVASLGCKIAKLSGRGLGHTGGTLDKLESVNGFRTDLSNKEFMDTVNKCGICVNGAGGEIVPADKKLYALRDVTATVNSIPLIVSSIMSKKLAGGAETIVLDVKTGSGAFMKTYEEARELASRMVSIGKLAGRKTSAVITNMDRPLGRAIGNRLEILEAVALLRNPQNPQYGDLAEVCITLASEMVSNSKNIPYSEAEKSVKDVLSSGIAYDTFKSWIFLQGGDISVLEGEFAPRYVTEIASAVDGYIASADAAGLGVAAMMLGAGRAAKEDIIDPLAGAVQIAKIGDKVKKGDIIARLYSDTVPEHSAAANRWMNSLTFSQTPPKMQPLIYEIIK